MIGVQFLPVDTWFFRDATPFTANKAPQEDVGSLFPPHPPTVAGALRAALARANGWQGQGSWPPEICEILGDGPHNMGRLCLAGPFLLRDGRPLFWAPRHLLGTRCPERWRPAGFLSPGAPVACDLGAAVRLPEYPEAGAFDVGADEWLTAAGMNSVLGGRLPGTCEVMSSKHLWSAEPRVGLERHDNTRTAKEGMLYSTRHVRLQRGVSLGMCCSGVPEDWTRPIGELTPLGGESRLAELQEWTPHLHLSAPTDLIRKTRKVALIALSPLHLEAEVCVGKKPVGGAGGLCVVSACLERPQRVGGWDSLGRRPLPLRSVLPPGSVLFCTIPDLDRFDRLISDDGTARVGSRQEWGFGLVALGLWPDQQ